MATWLPTHRRGAARCARVVLFLTLALLALLITVFLDYGNTKHSFGEPLNNNATIDTTLSTILHDADGLHATVLHHDVEDTALLKRTDLGPLGLPVYAPASSQNPAEQIAAGGSSHGEIQDLSAPPWINDLVLTSWALYVPLMLRTVDHAYELLDDNTKRREPSSAVWQKGNIKDQEIMSKRLLGQLGPPEWTRLEEDDNVEFRPTLAARALHINPPALGARRHAVWWKQDKPCKFKHPFKGSVQLTTGLEHKVFYEMDDGIIVVKAAPGMDQSMSQITTWLGELSQHGVTHLKKQGDPRSGQAYAVEDFLPILHELRQFIAYDWYKLSKNYKKVVSEFTLNHIAFEAVNLSPTSKNIVKQMIQYSSKDARHDARTGYKFRIGDCQYHAILALPEFNGLAWLLAERKSLFGTRVLSQVSVLGADGDATNDLSFIWSVVESNDKIYREVAVRHYSFVKTAIKHGLLKEDYYSKDRVIKRIRTIEQRDLESLQRAAEIPPARLSLQDVQAEAGAQASSGLGASDPAWQQLREERAKSPSPIQILENDAIGVGLLQPSNELPANFDEILSQAWTESEQDLSGQNPGSSIPAQRGQSGNPIVVVDDDEEDLYGATPPRVPAQGRNG